MKKIFITSTMSSGVDYTTYEKNEGGLSIPIGSISIKGGCGVVGKNNLYTPDGMATQITENELIALNMNKTFQAHVANGFLTIHKYKSDSEEVVKDMTSQDEGAQMTAKTLVNKNPRGRKPTVGRATTK